MRTKALAFLLLTGLCASCATVEPRSYSEILKSPNRPKIALVLGGGAARGFAHVGVIRALEKEGIPIDMIIGTSVGSLIGALYAQDGNSFDLEWTAFALQKEDMFDYGMLSAFTGMGVVKGDKLETFVKTKVKKENIEQMKIRYAAVATDLNRGTRVVLDKGSVVKAVHASCAIPGVFQPVEYMGKLLVDGGVIDNIPISTAHDMGADIVIAVDISENITNFNITNIIDVMIQSINIMFSENVASKKKAADVIIAPAVGDVAMLDFSQKKRCMEAGIDAATKAMPDIRKKIIDIATKKGSK
jgi:NTE family protein